MLNLKFGHDEEIIHLEIETYKLETHPPYIALSYTWGDPNDIVRVLCDGKIIYVTRNLKEALWQLREGGKRLIRQKFPSLEQSRNFRIWVDAICINQIDNREKSFQVGLMAKIYQKARYVMAWLGPATKSGDIAVNCLNTVGKIAEACGMENGYDVLQRLWHDMMFVPGERWRLAFTDPAIQNVDGTSLQVSGKALQALFNGISGWNDRKKVLPIAELKEFFTQSWWTRVWVLQEVTLSRETDIICGKHRISKNRCDAFINVYAALWKVLATAFQRDPRLTNQYQRDFILSLFHHRPNIMLSMPRIHHESRFTLSALLRLTCVGSKNPNRHGSHHLESSKPQDKIFALLGLAADRQELERYGVVPNYDLSYEEMYAITMAALLRQGHISLLSMCQTARSPNLPSWVPDWSRSITDMLQDVRNDHVTLYPKFTASGHDGQNPEVQVLTGTQIPRQISIKGYLYDEILQIGQFVDRDNSMEIPSSKAKIWPAEWLLEILRLSYCARRACKTFHDRLRTVVRTSIGDVGWDRDGQFTRVGDLRLADAVVILREGFQLIKNERIKLEAHRYLTSQAEMHTSSDKLGSESQLGMEISGKSFGRLPFVTERGHLGLSAECIKRGDRIAIIIGSQVPFVLRPCGMEQYRMMSEAYVDGIMDGETVDTIPSRPITLV